MEIPGFGGANPLRLNPNSINAPDALPVKVPPKLDEKTVQKDNFQQTPTLPDQAPQKPVISRNQQSFQNLLVEIGVPNTPQNNQLAQTLANYGQPINKNTMNQVANTLGNIMQQGPANIEAGVILLINNMPVNAKSIDSVKQMLTGGGLSQNLLVLNKDLQKLIDNVKDKDFVKNLESKIQAKQSNSPEIQNEFSEKKQVNDESVKPLKQLPQNSNQKIEETGLVKKNPFEEEFQEENQDTTQNNFYSNDSSKKSVKNESSKNQTFSLVNIDSETVNIQQNPKTIVNNLVNKAEKLSTTLNNLLSIDVLKNPANFPQQINLLKKHFADLEVDIEEIKEILESSFPELKEEVKTEDENIFTNLLKMVFDDGKQEVKKAKAKLQANNLNFEMELIKNLTDAAKSISSNVTGRELLTKNQECMCIPLAIPFNNKIYDVEIMINREDKSTKKAEVGEVPLKIQLAIQTHNMGKVGVDISNLKKDLQINLSVDDINIKNAVSKKLHDLQSQLNELPFDVKPVTCNVNPKPDESTSLLLPQKYKVMSMNRIQGIV